MALDEVVALAKALSDENRIRILASLRNGERCVCQVIELLALAPSTTSKHLAILKQAGLVQSRKEGRWMHYRLTTSSGTSPAEEAIRWVIANLENDPRIVADDRQLDSILSVERAELCCRQREGRRCC
ncbi:MAG: winged helix-turn-helix transcriptional regulator [Phycisphaerales bacterium]|nr:winged helix-turn-helix transcriptional regulator [Phycisphaerales bacterium]